MGHNHKTMLLIHNIIFFNSYLSGCMEKGDHLGDFVEKWQFQQNSEPVIFKNFDGNYLLSCLCNLDPHDAKSNIEDCKPNILQLQ